MSSDKKQARILIVDDEKINLQVLSNLLRDDYTLILARNGEQALERIFSGAHPDLILLDVVMPGMSGYEVLKNLKENESSRQIPVIFVTALDTPEKEEKGLALGAVDYIRKPFSAPIVQMRVRNHIRLVQQTHLLEKLASLDALTGIPNRREFERLFQQEFARAQRNRTELSLGMADVDHFKQYNDHYGHSLGDIALKRIAEALENSLLRPADRVIRYGGEEFTLLLPETDSASAIMVAERVREAVRALAIPHQASPTGSYVTVSIGITTIRPGKEDSPEELLQEADTRLYLAKSQGRNRVVY